MYIIVLYGKKMTKFFHIKSKEFFK